METINFTNIKNIRKLKKTPIIFVKNIFYIKLLVYFEDLEFIKYMNLKFNSFLWTVYILNCLIESKCSNKFLDQYIECYYTKHNLSQRLTQIIKLSWNNSVKNTKIIKRLSFYEKDKYADLSIKSGISPTVLLINKISSIDHLLYLSIKYNRWDCLIDMYLSKYINKDILVTHLPKCVRYFKFNLDKTRKKIYRLISVCEEIPELCNSGNFLLDLLGCIFTVYNKNCNYHLIRLSTILTNFFKTELSHIILSNQKLCDKFIEATNNFYSDFSIESIVSYNLKFKLNIPELTIYKTNITNSFIRSTCTSKFSIPEKTLIYLINNFKLDSIHIQTIFQHLDPEYDHLVNLLKKNHYIQIKNYLIDMQGSACPEIKCVFFKHFIKYKLLTPNEIKYFILDNINTFKYCNIKKFIKNFEEEYIFNLKSNILVSSNCLWILYNYYKNINDEIIRGVFEHIFKNNDQTYILYDIIESSIASGHSLRKIQDIFIEYFGKINFNFKDNWVLLEIFECIFITNVYLGPLDSLIHLLQTNKRFFENSFWKKITSIYKVD